MTIWKYDLKLEDCQTIPLPEGAVILSVQEQGEGLRAWAKFAPGVPIVPRTILIVGTGMPIPGRAGRYLGTVVMSGGPLVWHVFEAIDTEFPE